MLNGSTWVNGLVKNSLKSRVSAGAVRPSNFYMVEYCENFKMGFAKTLDFLRRLKTPSKALTRYK